jgi:hypothetical protein
VKPLSEATGASLELLLPFSIFWKKKPLLRLLEQPAKRFALRFWQYRPQGFFALSAA